MRKTYTVSKWDKEAGKGYATDGTSWEGDPIEFSVFTITIPDYNGYLDPGETITAVERIGNYPECERYLTDIIVESGPRSFGQVPSYGGLTSVFDPNPPTKLHRISIDGCDCGWRPQAEERKPEKTLGELYAELDDRMSTLEAQVYGRDD